MLTDDQVARERTVMIDVNRGLYLNEASATKGPHFDSCRSKLGAVMRELIENGDAGR